MKITTETTLKDVFDFSICAYKQNKFLSFINGSSYTYEEFGEKTKRISQILTSHGLQSQDKVALLSQNMPNWSVAYFSIAAFGKVVVPILPDFSESEIANIIEHSETKALFVSKRLRSKISNDLLQKMAVVIETDTLDIVYENPNYAANGTIIDPKAEDLATIIYTSGTTGHSKGVMLSHRNLCSHLEAVSILRPSYEWDIWLSLLPLSHTLECSLCMMLPMFSGSSVYYIEKAPTPTVLLSALKEVRPTTILSVPLIIEKIYRNTILPKFNKSPFVKFIYSTKAGRKTLHYLAGKKLKETFGGRVRFFGIGGAKLDGQVEQFLYEAKFPYAIGYGLTETAPLLAGAIPNMVKWQSTGPAMHGVNLRIDNPNPLTGEGEIVAKAPNVMMGYFKNPEATKDAFTDDGWFRTKDLGILDKKNRLYIKGRLNNMILGPSGENIYPEEIESVLNTHAMVSESIVTQGENGALIAKVHLNPDKLKVLAEATEEALSFYYSKKEQLLQSYAEGKEELKHVYEEKKEELSLLFNEKIEQIKHEIYLYVNARVNKFSRISIVVDHPQQFEKTATQKIKRYMYTGR